MKDKATGHCAVIVSNGDRSFMTHLGCIEDFRGVDILTDLPLYGYGRVKEIDSVSTIAHYHQHVHVAGYYNIGGFWNGELACKLAEMKAKASRKVTISLVPQQDATNSWDGGLLDVLKYVDFLILSEIEAHHITKYQCDACDIDFIQHVANYFSSHQTYIIVTLQSKGAVALYDGQVIHTQQTVSIANPVDPTGAGDAFAAGFIYGFLQHYAEVDDDFRISAEAVREGMRWGCAIGTSSIMVQGASVPSRKECIEKLLSNNHKVTS
jgi:sugar/nucleoside kinase (ribokinase family)